MHTWDKFKKIFEKKLVWSWIFSYIIVFLLPFGSILYLYPKNEKILKDQIYNTDNHALEMALLSIDNLISSFSQTVASIETSPEVKKLETVDQLTPSIDWTAIDVANCISQQILYSDYIAAIYLYCPKIDYVISNSFCGSSSRFFNYYYSGIDVSYQSWLDRMNAFNYAHYITSNSENGFIDFFYSLPLRTSDTNHGITVGIRISYDTLHSFIEQYILTNETNLYILDKNNQVIFQRLSMLQDFDIANLDDIRRQKNLTVFTSTSSINNWKLICLTPNNALYGKLRQIHYIVAITCILSLLMAVLLICFFTWRNYNPIQKVSNLAIKYGNFNNTKDEYEIITNILEDYKSKTKKISQLQNITSNMEKKNFLSSLVTGNVDYNLLQKNLEQFHISFLSDYFIVTVFNVTDISSIFIGDEDIPAHDETDYTDTISFIISNVFEEILDRKHYGVVFPFNGFNIAIISLNPKYLSDWYENIADNINEAREFITKNFNFSFTASISNIHNNISELGAAYTEASRTLNYRSLIKNNEVLFYGDVDNNIFDLCLAPEKLKQISSLIRLGNAKLTQNAVDSLLDELTESNNLQSMNFLIIKICSVILDTIYSLSKDNITVNLSPLLSSLDNLLVSLKNNSSPEKLHDLIQTACALSVKINAEKKNIPSDLEFKEEIHKIDDIIARIKDYIQENFTNSELNVASIGYHFDITPYYVSSIFKNSEKITILNYIAKLRIEAAKSMIESTDKPINQIALETGFNNIRTFMRIFTKTVGITPGQYRDVVKQNTKE